ncbi:RDD family protein [Streptomyces sp. ITFR-6]|uniref:RDD family protein n=1 Tax=Streptomyces sp. ITFR-6 TaxID=3075197 RepID=UPI00288AFE31|nr:RDD family protein [Streptomyces sp. ITFR-6]WNI31673.1 RDD family protein [Streptomyces sp. ITFR-6]
MSAPTPAPGDESPREGYYPDPSIPGYVRYWNGASWVPGTSRPAPQSGESMPSVPDPEPAEPHRPAPAPVDETGPMFFDEEPLDDVRSEPSPAWQADVSRQNGFGGEHDRRVSWGGRPGPQPVQPAPGPDPRTAEGDSPAADTPGDRSPVLRSSGDRSPAVRRGAELAPVDPRLPVPPGRETAPSPAPAPDPAAGALPGMRDGGDRAENTVAIRVARSGRSGRSGGSADSGGGDRDGQEPSAEGTMTIRAIGPAVPAAPQAAALGPAQQQGPAFPQQAQALQQAQAPQQAQTARQIQAPQQARQPQQAEQTHRPQQAQQPPLAQAPHQAQGPDQPVVPWKPPVNDHFQQLAAAQSAARPAALGKRFAARLIDTVVLGALVGAVAFPLATRAADHINEKIDAAKLSGETVTVWLLDSTTAGLAAGVLVAFLVLGVLLEALPTAKWGRTLGKKLCGLGVRDIESGSSPTFGAALRRWLVYGVLGLLAVGVLNVLWCLIDRPWRQCWHDKAARTFVAG